jgi:hypothetical protein
LAEICCAILGEVFKRSFREEFDVRWVLKRASGIVVRNQDVHQPTGPTYTPELFHNLDRIGKMLKEIEKCKLVNTGILKWLRLLEITEEIRSRLTGDIDAEVAGQFRLAATKEQLETTSIICGNRIHEISVKL